MHKCNLFGLFKEQSENIDTTMWHHMDHLQV